MTRRAIVGKSAAPRRDYWRERIAEQERSGLTVGRFCKEQGLTEQSFYLWRKRLLEQQPMRFALVETGSARRQLATEARSPGGCRRKQSCLTHRSCYRALFICRRRCRGSASPKRV